MRDSIFRSWKTTVLGAVVIIIGVVAFFVKGDATFALGLITMGSGFIVAKDANVSGGSNV